MRMYQQKSRGGGDSIKTELENVYILFAWEAALLSEGQVAKALQVDRVTARRLREHAEDKALQIAEGLLPAPEAKDE